LEYLRAEPMKEYEEQKAERQKKEAQKDKTPDTKLEASEPSEADMPADAVDGMMSGVPGHAKAKAEDKKPPLPVTAWGRYAKVLLSSGEFLYVN
jgi:hypothetical protein